MPRRRKKMVMVARNKPQQMVARNLLLRSYEFVFMALWVVIFPMQGSHVDFLKTLTYFRSWHDKDIRFVLQKATKSVFARSKGWRINENFTWFTIILLNTMFRSVVQ